MTDSRIWFRLISLVLSSSFSFFSNSILDLTLTDADLKGFIGGFTDGRYGYFVPYNNGAYFGKVARVYMNFGGNL